MEASLAANGVFSRVQAVPNSVFNEQETIHTLKHYLPAQAPLKDFIHHNTLHAFQHLKFETALCQASALFGYRTSLSVQEYQSLYRTGHIREEILNKVICSHKTGQSLEIWKDKLLSKSDSIYTPPKIGQLRTVWKTEYQVDMDFHVHPTLFRVLCSYLDQGISIWNFPVHHKGFLASAREIEQNSFFSFFKTKRAKELLLDHRCNLKKLLEVLVGDESVYEHYLFDQQFAHQGWSGIVSSIEDHPWTLLDHKKISIHDLIFYELLLEIDALDYELGEHWQPLGTLLREKPTSLFAETPKTEISEILYLWQEAYEWSYYDQVLAGIVKQNTQDPSFSSSKSFQAMFCIDDRECSLRRYLETSDLNCETFGTPGFFNVEFFYKPEHGKFYTKLCPAPVKPNYLIKEIGGVGKRKKDAHFTKHSHSLFRGWIIAQTLGFWSAFRLFLNIFKPTVSPATATSFSHTDKVAKLTIENKGKDHRENHLQIGFTVDEMAQRVEGLLKSIGLVNDFAPIIYIVGHGSSSVNNPHYAAYDCGACSGRPGSVNARVICFMANHPEVRKKLHSKGLIIPNETQFIGGIHDTTRDEVVFFDEDLLSSENSMRHNKHEQVFAKALRLNAKERSRRFESIDTKSTPKRIHEKVKRRSVSLFEPRPELNHATNSLCIVGRRELTKKLFLDRRAFLNSYDYRVDPEGKYLTNILKAAAPVCGGINLEYFFSRVDNQKLGAGTKLPHNVMGLFGVANGIDGDLRPGLPSQMIEVHDPIRLLIIVEHFPEVVLTTIQKQSETYEWFINEWIHLVVVHPETNALLAFKSGHFEDYIPHTKKIDVVLDSSKLVESSQNNLPVSILS